MCGRLGVICALDPSEVAHCLHDPDAMFMAHARADVPWLLDQLRAERSADLVLDERLPDRVLALRAAIRVANDWLNRLPWRGRRAPRIGRRGPGPRDQARWICQVLEAVASFLDPETLGLKGGGS